MKNMYYSRPSAGVLRLSGMILGMCLLFQTVLAAAIAPSIQNQEFPVQENAPNGSQIGTIQATDAISYHILSGNEEGVFALDASTGELTVSDNSLLDYETTTSFSLTVEVWDAEGVASQAEVTILVQNIDVPTAVSGNAANITENSASLDGSFETGGDVTVAAIQYGLEAALPAFAPEGAEVSVTAAPEEVENAVELTLTDLQDNTTYYYRSVAKNSEGTVYGETKSFTTLSIPWVESITIRDSNPTNAEVVTYLVTFTEAVNGLNIADFDLELIPEIVEGAFLTAVVSDVTPSGETGSAYIVTISDIDGDGTLKLIFKDNGTVESVNGVNVGGEGTDNGTFEEGEIYTIDNTPPSAYALIYTNEDVVVRHSFSVSNSPDDPEALIFSFSSTNTALVGNDSYELQRKGSNWEITIIPTLHMHGETDITIYVKDQAGNISEPPIKLKVVVRAVADAPLLVANNVEGEEDDTIPLEVGVSLVDLDGSETLKNIKINGVPTGAALSAGTHIGSGTYTFADATLLQNVNFIPETNTSGVYTLTLEATSEEIAEGDLLTKKRMTASKTFTVTVNPVNDAPAFALDPTALTLKEDFTLERYVAIEPADVPADEQDQVVTYSVAVKDGAEPIANVVVEQDENGAYRLKITSIADANGTQVFTVTANDGQAENNLSTQDFTLTVTAENDAPAFALVPDNKTLLEDFADAEYVEIKPEAVPADEQEQVVTYSVAVKDGADAIADVVVGQDENGKPRLEITSIADANGTQVFIVAANDGQAENNLSTQDFTLTVTAENDAPAFALVPDNKTLLEDFADAEYVEIKPEAVPADEQEQVVTYSVAVKDGAEPIATVVVEQDENGAYRLKITSIADANGMQVFTVTANDGQAENNLFTQDFTLTIEAVNDAPAFSLSRTEVVKEEDFAGTEVITVTDNSPENETENVNYSLTPSSVPFANVSIDAATGGISISAVANGHGSQTFTVTADDGSLTSTQSFTLTVTPVNDAPAFELSQYEVVKEEDFAGTEVITVTDNSPENETENVNYSLTPSSVPFVNVAINATTGEISISAVAEAHGTRQFTVTASDGELTATQTFTLTVTPVNDAPAFSLSRPEVVKEEDFAGTEVITVTDNSPENEGEDVTYSLTPASVAFANVAINSATGEISISAVANGHGSQTFTVTADDGSLTSTQSFTLTVTPVNDAPAFELSQYEVVKEEDFAGTEVVNVVNQTNPENEGETVVYSLSPAPETVDFANITLNASTGTITIAAEPNMFGSQDFVVTASDGTLTASRNFSLVVNPVNDAPEFTLDRTEVIVEEDFTSTETITPTLVRPFPFGETGEEVVFSLNPASVDFANVSIDPATGLVTITAVQDKNGEQVFEITATDNGQPVPASTVKTLLLRVVPVRDDPTLAGELADQAIYEDEAYEYTIPAGVFTDPDGDETLSFTASLVGGAALPAWLSFDAATRTFSGTPENDDAGTLQIEVVAEDPTGHSVTDDFTLEVVPVNDVPTISEIADLTIDLGNEVPAIPFTISDEETLATELILTVLADDNVLLPASAIAVEGEGENRTLVFSPEIEQYGVSEVTVTVSDGEAEASESFTFTISYKELAVDIPTLITPNGDGANDTWNLRYLSLYETNAIRVFDRTGKLVFESRNYLSGPEWDGTLGGNELPEGIYFYEIKLNEGAISKKGTLTIAR